LPGGRDVELDEAISLGFPAETLEDGEYSSEELPVQPSDYRLWDAAASTETTSHSLSLQSLHHHDVMNKYRTWQSYVKETRRSLNFGRVPQLDRLLAIMAGDFANYVFTDWSEAFLADLLFRKPDFRPRDISKRARKFVREYCPSDVQFQLDPIISIMEGNAANAIHLLHIYGGGTGAALPATMVSFVVVCVAFL
jgi:hypothetical protein